MWDDAIHAYYLNTRYYGPEMVRFISADSILTDEQIPLESNVYAYCLSNPIAIVYIAYTCVEIIVGIAAAPFTGGTSLIPALIP